jgi:hypothetical protein
MTETKLIDAIEVLMAQLAEQVQEVSETKKTINSLRRRIGQEPLFPDVSPEQLGGSSVIRPDQYYGRPLATAVQEFLAMRKQACQPDEIIRALDQGAFDFRSLGWKESDRLRAMAISLSKNNTVFHRLPNGTFGLLAWYPEVINRKAKEKRQADAESKKDDDVLAE